MDAKYSRYYTYIKPVVRNPIIRTYYPLAFGVVLTTIFIVFAIRPTLITIVSLQKSIDEQSQVLKKLQTKSQNITEGKKRYENLDLKVRQSIEELLPDKTDPAGLMRAIERNSQGLVASISGIQIETFELIDVPENLGKDITLQEISFSFNLSSDYHQANTLINRLRSSQRLMYINSISLTSQQDSRRVSTSVNGKAYIAR